jgi:hypothetical protein
MSVFSVAIPYQNTYKQVRDVERFHNDRCLVNLAVGTPCMSEFFICRGEVRESSRCQKGYTVRRAAAELYDYHFFSRTCGYACNLARRDILCYRFESEIIDNSITKLYYLPFYSRNTQLCSD